MNEHHEEFVRLARELYPLTFPLWMRVILRPVRGKFLALMVERAEVTYEAKHGRS